MLDSTDICTYLHDLKLPVWWPQEWTDIISSQCREHTLESLRKLVTSLKQSQSKGADVNISREIESLRNSGTDSRIDSLASRVSYLERRTETLSEVVQRAASLVPPSKVTVPNIQFGGNTVDRLEYIKGNALLSKIATALANRLKSSAQLPQNQKLQEFILACLDAMSPGRASQISNVSINSPAPNFDAKLQGSNLIIYCPTISTEQKPLYEFVYELKPLAAAIDSAVSDTAVLLGNTIHMPNRIQDGLSMFV